MKNSHAFPIHKSQLHFSQVTSLSSVCSNAWRNVFMTESTENKNELKMKWSKRILRLIYDFDFVFSFISFFCFFGFFGFGPVFVHKTLSNRTVCYLIFRLWLFHFFVPSDKVSDVAIDANKTENHVNCKGTHSPKCLNTFNAQTKWQNAIDSLAPHWIQFVRFVRSFLQMQMTLFYSSL